MFDLSVENSSFGKNSTDNNFEKDSIFTCESVIFIFRTCQLVCFIHEYKYVIPEDRQKYIRKDKSLLISLGVGLF